MDKPRDSKGRFKAKKEPKKHLIRLTDSEKQMVEERRKKGGS